MKSTQIRSRFLDFFRKRGHAILKSAPLVPENDPTVLFNTAGMQPLVPYLMGEPHPGGDKLADAQKCVRTTDIDDIGDNTHATFFEMLGNWSLGSYFKEEAIRWSYEFLFSKDEGLGLDPQRLYVTVFEGDEKAGVPRDDESFKIWKQVGVPEHRIYFKGADTNWWPAVKGKDTWTGPTGPCTEMFYDVTEAGLGDLTKEEYMKADDTQKVVEIWNDVFMQYEKKDGAIVGKLKKNNVDTGAGLERIAAILQGVPSIFDTDLFSRIMTVARTITANERDARIVSDHIRSATFLIGDGVRPSNSDQGYILRRLLRRAIFKTTTKSLTAEQIRTLIDAVRATYDGAYPEIDLKAGEILTAISEENDRFVKTIKHGVHEFEKLIKGATESKQISGKDAFALFSTYGFPIEMTVEMAKEHGLGVDRADYEKHYAEHQALSRSGSEQKFKGGLGDTSEMSVKYHTATHLLHQALRQVLGTHVEQRGSNITPERLRFDFAHTGKMTDEEKRAVETLVNKKIENDLPVRKVVLPKEEAEKTGALHFFGEKYADQVSVYYIGEEAAGIAGAFSKEFCGGPHVEHTGLLGTFKIAKEEAVSAGVRRIKATLS